MLCPSSLIVLFPPSQRDNESNRCCSNLRKSERGAPVPAFPFSDNYAKPNNGKTEPSAGYVNWNFTHHAISLPP